MPIRLSGKEIVKALTKKGWTIERVSGSHHVMRHPDGHHVSVPVYGSRPLPAGIHDGRDAAEVRAGVSVIIAQWPRPPRPLRTIMRF